MLRITDALCVELSVGDVAGLSGRSERAVQLAVRAGVLPVLRRVGRSWVIDDVAALAWVRALGSGRMFSGRVRAAAFALLDDRVVLGLAGSELSRLRARMSVMSTQEFAHAVGGLGGRWGRYRRSGRGVLVGARYVGLVEEGIVGQAVRRLVQVADLGEFELRSPVVLDADGDLGVVEREGEVTLARRLLDTYLVGESRVSHAAAAEIERRLLGVGS